MIRPSYFHIIPRIGLLAIQGPSTIHFADRAIRDTYKTEYTGSIVYARALHLILALRINC